MLEKMAKGMNKVVEIRPWAYVKSCTACELVVGRWRGGNGIHLPPEKSTFDYKCRQPPPPPPASATTSDGAKNTPEESHSGNVVGGDAMPAFTKLEPVIFVATWKGVHMKSSIRPMLNRL